MRMRQSAGGAGGFVAKRADADDAVFLRIWGFAAVITADVCARIGRAAAHWAVVLAVVIIDAAKIRDGGDGHQPNGNYSQTGGLPNLPVCFLLRAEKGGETLWEYNKCLKQTAF